MIFCQNLLIFIHFLLLVALIHTADGQSGDLKFHVSDRISTEMRRYRTEIAEQLLKNRDVLTAKVQWSNRLSALAAVFDTMAVFLNVASLYSDRTFLDLPTVSFALGYSTEFGAYDYESFEKLQKLDISCAEKLQPLLNHFDLDRQLGYLETEVRRGNSISGLEARKTRILLDVVDFRREFKDQLACLLTPPDINAEQQHLLGLMHLYTKAAELRLELL